MTAAPGRDFTFVHLSDPHLTSLEAVRWPQLLGKRLLGYLSWRRRRRAEHRVEVLDALARDLAGQRYDHLVVTGDLTHISLPDEFEQARRWLDRLGAPEHVSIVPGNHDSYVPGAADGLTHWAPFMASDAAGGDTGPAFPSLRVRDDIAFIGLSSAVPSPPLFATGTVGAQQRERFARLLQWAGERGLFRVVMIHHPPVPGLEKWRKRLTDAGEVGEIIDRHGAELVLHGHCHRPLESRLSHAGRRHVPVIGVPSASSIHHDPERVSQYALYRISRGQRNWVVEARVRGYSHDTDSYQQWRELRLEIPARA